MTAMNVWDIHGGIHPPERKTLSNGQPIQHLPVPPRLVVALAQHLGAPAEPCVTLGAQVLKGQKIAEASGFVSAPIHAPTSGTVSFIGPQPYPHASGIPAAAIVIDSDGQDRWAVLQPRRDYRDMPPEELLTLIREAGISGLGGAGFPTAVKLKGRPGAQTRTLIINGTECEPYITADDLLMRERADELVAGIDILAHLIQPAQVMIGIEDNKPEAIAAVRAAVERRDYQVKVFPTKYPSGGEKQLIQILTGEEVPSGGLPADIGMLCQNVGTCVAIHDAVLLGKPLISRITTLTGEALARPMNVEVPIGTPVRDLLLHAGLDEGKLDRLIMGGPMMGFSLPSLDAPVIKTTNCLLASTHAELPPPSPAMPCIRCGECAEACPASLLPQQLHFFALGQEHDQLKAYNLFDCIECGACAYVCPSSIPLVQYYRAAKGEIRALEHKQQKAEHSRQRFEWRQERLRRAEEQKEADRKARAERAARAKAAQADPTAASQDDTVARLQASKTGLSDEQKKFKIEASMAQVALKKAEKQLATHATAELEQQVATLREAAARAQQALEQAMAAAPQAHATPAAAAGDAAKKAKIEAAMLRAQVRRLEKLDSLDPEHQAELNRLQAQLASAEQALSEAQEAAPAAAAATPPRDDAAKKAKIEAAMLRAQVRKLEKLDSLDPEQQAELNRLQAQLASAEKAVSEAQEAAPAAAAATPSRDDAAKKAKIEAAMLRAQVRKLEKLDSLDPEHQAELNRVQAQLASAEQALSEAQEAAAPTAPVKAAKDETLKKAKIELAMKRAELKKAEQSGADETETNRLRDALAGAEQALHAAEANSFKPAPVLERTEKRPVDDATRALKTELAFARADVRKLERDAHSDPVALDVARARLNEAEHKLQAQADAAATDSPQA